MVGGGAVVIGSAVGAALNPPFRPFAESGPPFIAEDAEHAASENATAKARKAKTSCFIYSLQTAGSTPMIT
jgi:hypothetical protein